MACEPCIILHAVSYLTVSYGLSFSDLKDGWKGRIHGIGFKFTNE